MEAHFLEAQSNAPPVESTIESAFPVIQESKEETVASAPPVEPTEDSAIAMPSVPPTTTPSAKDLASASVVQSMFAYKARQPDEMTFPEGALIEVLSHEEEGWWRGRIQSTGVEGLFPVNYVKPYKSSTSNSIPTSSSPVSPTAKPCKFFFLLLCLLDIFCSFLIAPESSPSLYAHLQ